MVLPSFLLSILAGIALGSGLHSTKLTSPHWMANKPSPEMILSFLSIFSISFLLQAFLGENYLSTPYLSYLHLIGGLIFGLGLFLVKSCPLSMLNLSHLYQKKWQSLLLFILFFIIGIYAGTLAAPLLIGQKNLSGYSLYFFDLLSLSPLHTKLALFIILLIFQVFIFKKSRSHFKLLIGSSLLASGIFLVQTQDVEVGTIIGFKLLTFQMFTDPTIISFPDLLFFITLLITLTYFARGTSLPLNARARPDAKVLAGFFLFGVGGEIGGGCTLTHGLDGISALSVGSLVFIASAVTVYMFAVFLFPKARKNV